MLNYTVTSTQIEAVAGTQVNLTTPFILLTITPDPGYTVTAGDFSIGDALPSEVSTVVFIQAPDGTVEAQVNFDNSFIMPSSAVSLGLDIDGTADLIEYSIAGTYAIATTNTNLVAASGFPFSGTGAVGETVTLFSIIGIADSEYGYVVDPIAQIFDTNALPVNYTITRDDFFTGDNLTTVIWTVKYLITADNVTGDQLKFTANAEKLLVITPGTESIYSYIFKDMPEVDTSGEYSIDNSAQQYILQVFGDVGAQITIDYTANGGLTIPSTNIVTNAEIVNDVGYLKIPINFGVTTAPTVYEFTLSGDLDVGFVQPNPIVVYTFDDITIDLDISPLSGYTIIRSGVYELSGKEGAVSRAEQVNKTFSVEFQIMADDNSILNIQKLPLWSDFTNLDATTNGGTEFLYSPALRVVGENTNKITITAVATLGYIGNADVSAILDIANMFNSPPVAVNDYYATLKGKAIFLDVTANDTDTGGAILIPAKATDPTYGTASDSDPYIQYTHDNSTNFSDSFTYTSTDGVAVSNTATVQLDIGVEPETTKVLTGGEGIYEIETVIGVDGAVLGFHFDAGTSPARMEIYYDGVLQADTLFVGDDLTGGGRATAISNITGTVGLDSFRYVGGFGDGLTYGVAEEWNLLVAGNIVSYTDPADIAATGTSRSVTENTGNQVGIVDNTFTSKIDTVGTTGFDSADGNVAVETPIAPGTPHLVKVRITGISGSSWELYQITRDPWAA